MKNPVKINFAFATIILCLVLLGNVNAGVKTDLFDKLIKQAVEQIYNIKFEEADSTVNKLKTDFPNHPAGYFFDAMIYWWKIMLDFNNEKYDDILEDKLEEVIDLCDDIIDEDPENVDAIFFKGGALGYRGRLGAVREDWFSAGLDGKEALPLVYRAYELDSLNNDVQLGFGIYNYYASVIPERYPMVKPIMMFFPSGDKAKGITQLENAAFNGKYSKYEARYFLMTLFYRYEKNYSEALKYAELLTSEFPNNPSFQRYHGRIYVGMSNYTNASVIFRDVRNKCMAGKRGYSLWTQREADYYLAMNYKNRGELDSAITYFYECAAISERIDEDGESGFYVSAVLHSAGLNERLGKIEKAIELYEKVLDMNEYRNSHQKAEQSLEMLFK